MIERLPQNYIPTHYDLHIHFKEETYPFDASVAITFQKNSDSNSVTLFLQTSITIKAITQNNLPLEYAVDYPKLTIQRSSDPQIDFSTYPINIEYSLQPNTQNRWGFFVYKGNYLTDFEPNGCRWLLPCFDEPTIRSSFTVTIKIPSKLTGISNMPKQSETEIGDEKEITFQPTPPMCTYLLCICVGTFSSIEGTTINDLPVIFYAETGREEQFYDLLQAATFSVEWIEENFGVKYELPHLQLISYEGCPNGMENYGLITLSDYGRRGHFLWKAKVVMHEVIHQWFGDLVAIKWWDSLWLNEGFAQFIQYLIMDDFSADVNAMEMFNWNDGMHSFRYFKHGKVVPAVSEVKYRGLFDSLVYCKGAYVLKMFYDIVGRENFFKICKCWLATYKNKNAEVRDFVQIASLTLFQDYTGFFNSWLRYPGFPILIVNEIDGNEGEVNDPKVSKNEANPVAVNIDINDDNDNYLYDKNNDFMKKIFDRNSNGDNKPSENMHNFNDGNNNNNANNNDNSNANNNDNSNANNNDNSNDNSNDNNNNNANNNDNNNDNNNNNNNNDNNNSNANNNDNSNDNNNNNANNNDNSNDNNNNNDDSNANNNANNNDKDSNNNDNNNNNKENKNNVTKNENKDNAPYKEKVGVTISQASTNDIFYFCKISIIYGYKGEVYQFDTFLNNYTIQLNFKYDWIFVNNNISSLCYVIYSNELMRSLVKAKNEGRINRMNRSLIAYSVYCNPIPYLVDEENYKLSTQFYH